MIKPLYIGIVVIVIAAILLAIYFVSGTAKAESATTGDTVQVYYTGTLTNGTVFDSNVGKQPLVFTVGSGQVIAGFDKAVIGMTINQTVNVTIPSNDAYGPVNPNLIVSVPLSRFSNKTITVGETITETGQGQTLQGIVKSVNSTSATIDFNSPLAGQTLIFKIKLAGIQKPSNQSK